MSAAMLKTLQTSQTEDSMRALYRTYGSELYGFALSALGDRGQAEELVQEVFTRVWRHAESYDPNKASFRTWLYGIARNAIIDLKRRQSVRPALAAHAETEDQQPVAEDNAFERALLRWQVASALERLTPEHRQVIRLAHFQGLTLREIAERTGIPLGTIKSRTSYALRGLRLALEEMGVEPS
jgi:RNA polymerase sigma-70 factor (ECF subfamily)